MIWDILEIEPTSDIKKIKRAYSRLAKIYNPEECPDEFRRIYDAYKMACKYAKGAERYNNYNVQGNLNDLQEKIPKLDFSYALSESADVITEDEKTSNSYGYDFDCVNLDDIDYDDEQNIYTSEDDKLKRLKKKMRKLVTDENMRDNLLLWEQFFGHDDFQCFIYDNRFRMFASDLIFEVLFTPEAAQLIANNFGRNSTAEIVIFSPVPKWKVSILGLGGKIQPPEKRINHMQGTDYDPGIILKDLWKSSLVFIGVMLIFIIVVYVMSLYGY